MRLGTVRGHSLLEVSSAMQKAIRRADAKLAGYWAIELWESGYDQYVWRRLLTISAEDCWGIITQEIQALHYGYNEVNKVAKKSERKGRIFVAKAVILLTMARKSRDADHLTNLVYDKNAISETELEASIQEARSNSEEIPDYAFDCHTSKGKKLGKTKEQFFQAEFAALEPREKGLFDDLVAGMV